jgi:hypothetical protein
LYSGLPISDVEFPAVVICSQGFNIETLHAAFYKIVLDHLKLGTTKSPIQLAKTKVKTMTQQVS